MPTLEELIEHPQESLDVELKAWLDLRGNREHRGLLAKAIIALANHGGGFVFIGFSDAGDGAANRPIDLAGYGQDDVNDIVRRFCEPAFHVSVRFVTRRADDLAYPVVVVPGGHKAPIRSCSQTDQRSIVNNTYYIRRLGPSSEPPTDGRDWDQLISRCLRNRQDEMLAEIRDLLSGRAPVIEIVPDEQALHSQWLTDCKAAWRASLDAHAVPDGQYQWMPEGHWTFAYSLLGDFERMDANRLAEVMRAAYRQITGWPVFMWLTRQEVRPVQREQGIIECHIVDHVANDNSAHSDFWRASDSGRLFLRRGFIEDSGIEGLAPRTVFDSVLPIWRSGEALLHAKRFAEIVGAKRALVTTRWVGLRDRRLTVIPGPDRNFFEPVASGVAAQDVVDTQVELDVVRIAGALPEIVREFLRPLYSAFDFAETPPIEFVAGQLDHMTGRNAR